MLGRLTFNVTQACNLRCTYCYALGGSYGGPVLRMQPHVAETRLRDIAAQHQDIHFIQFIGGEPLLNPTAMRVVCETTRELVQTGTLVTMPRFGVVTNLTILTPAVLAMLRDYEINTVVSLDGPPEVHDALRRTAGDQPTHARIVRNVDRLRDAGVRLEFEATYTRVHLASGITVVDLLKYFSRWHPAKINIATVMASEENPVGLRRASDWPRAIRMELDALRFTADEWHQGNYIPYGLFMEISRALLDKSSTPGEFFCPAGVSNLAVAADGALYSCHMFTNNAHYLVADHQGRNTPVPPLIPNKQDFTQCSTCWARRWCKVCVGRMETESPGSPSPPPENCERTRRALELVLQTLPHAIGATDISVGH